MARAVQELRQIPFERLIGAPMTAAIEAQAAAAQSTIEFIQKVGFKTPDGGFEPADLLITDTDADADAGDLRSVTFSYEKKDENGEVSAFHLKVPLLSIVPIPYIRIDEMTLDFSAKLTDAIMRKTDTSFNLDSSVSGKFGGGFLVPFKMSFRVSSTYNTKTSKASAQKSEYRLDINIRAVQDEMPGGLSKILDILEDAIQDTKAPVA
ncbi:DUF2589 domain-containing protein [Nocardia amamiensis]|uniref:DUF2589 domain-containing protein n=1 Tax=Nocardia amamiensis TaxID=404578 RepID=UPI000829EEB1|nr:DUF2589 domain-containing protein [Nocardia amamiensis]